MQVATSNPALTLGETGQAVTAKPDDATVNNADRYKSSHTIAYRASSSILGRRFYLTIFFGAEKRTDARLNEEGQKKSFLKLLVSLLALVWLIFWITVVVIGLAVVAAYLLKSAAGINLFEEHSFLHPFFFD